MPPVSRRIQSVISSVRSSRSAAARRRIRAFSLPGVGAQARWARVASSPARRMSSGAAEPTTASTSSVALSRTSIAPPPPAVHPPEKILPCQLAASSTFVIGHPSCARGLYLLTVMQNSSLYSRTPQERDDRDRTHPDQRGSGLLRRAAEPRRRAALAAARGAAAGGTEEPRGPVHVALRGFA